MKHVYFIRHGETLANRSHRHQQPDEPLSKQGEAEALEAVKLLKELKIDTLVASSYVRARETAEILGEELGLPIIPMDEVVEFRRPASIYGKHHLSLASFSYLWDLYQHQADPKWDNDGAENLFTIRNRMLTAQQKIEALPGKQIAVVSHAIFMDMFTQMVCTERDLKLREFIRGLLMTKKIPNLGVITFVVDDNAPGGTCKWWFEGVGEEVAVAPMPIKITEVRP